jgi:hypothetical protein
MSSCDLPGDIALSDLSGRILINDKGNIRAFLFGQCSRQGGGNLGIPRLEGMYQDLKCHIYDCTKSRHAKQYAFWVQPIKLE